MKKISFIALLLLSTSFAQLRVGADFSREMKLGGLDAEKSEGMGITLGYEKMLLGLIGAGGEFTLGGDERLMDEQEQWIAPNRLRVIWR